MVSRRATPPCAFHFICQSLSPHCWLRSGERWPTEGDSQWQSSHEANFTLYAKALNDYNKHDYVYSTEAPLKATNGYRVFRSGGPLVPSALTWYWIDVPTNGVMEYTLTLPGFRSWPVVVEFANGVPSEDHILFEMSREHQ